LLQQVNAAAMKPELPSYCRYFFVLSYFFFFHNFSYENQYWTKPILSADVTLCMCEISMSADTLALSSLATACQIVKIVTAIYNKTCTLQEAFCFKTEV